MVLYTWHHKKSEYNFNNVTSSTIFLNSLVSPNSFPFLTILKLNKCIYLWKSNNTLTVKIIRKNLLRFLNIQLEIHQTVSKRDELNRIWETIMLDKPSLKRIKSGIICFFYCVYLENVEIGVVKTEFLVLFLVLW